MALHRGNWAKGACEPQRLIVAGERIVVLLHVRVRLAHETEWREGRIADVFTFRNGKAIQWRTFVDERQAHAWAGGTPQGRLTSTVAVRAQPETANGKCPSDTLT